MPFLPPNQQHQSTEGKAKSKTTIYQSALSIFCSLLHRLEQVVAVQIWVAQRVAQLSNMTDVQQKSRSKVVQLKSTCVIGVTVAVSMFMVLSS